MRKRLLLLSTILVFTVGCGDKGYQVEEEILEKEPVIEEVIEEEKYYSPISGIETTEEISRRRPVAIMFDNHNKARWQAGLKDAEIVYEMPVEYPYTRYMGVYILNSPETIGSVRSARPYFIEKAMEMDAIYVRVGGSEQAKKDIVDYKIDGFDGLGNIPKVFVRKKHKKMPHNMYTNMGGIREVAREKAYREESLIESYNFNLEGEETIAEDGNMAKDIFIRYNKSNTTKYIYDEELKSYRREKDGKLHIDEVDESPILAKNIIIQRASVKTVDNEGRLSVNNLGSGEGYFFTGGYYKNVTWKKDSKSSLTRYYDSLGNEISLNPGQTWIQVVDINTQVDIS